MHNSTFVNNSKRIPPTFNGGISNFGLFQWCEVLIFETKCQMPILQLQINQLFYVFICRICPMKITSVFLVIHSHSCGIIWAIDNTNIFPICLCIIYHKPFKMGLPNAIPCHNFNQFCPHDALNICVIWLHVTCSNGCHFIIHRVINMASHGGLFFYMFDMVKHNPWIF